MVRCMIDFESDDERGLLAVQAARTVEVHRPGHTTFPRRIEIEDSRGIWIPFIIIPFSDTERLIRAKLGARRGWRNRLTLAIRGRSPCTIVGIDYLVAASG